MELTPRLQLSRVEEANDTELDYIGVVVQPGNEKSEDASVLIAPSSAEAAKSLLPQGKEPGQSRTTVMLSRVGSADNPKSFPDNADMPPLSPPAAKVIQVR